MHDMKSFLKCKDCKYFSVGKNMSLCKYKSSWEITDPDNNCWFLPEFKELTCGDCWCLGNDMGCAGCRPEESAYINGKLCPDFTDRKEDELYGILSYWKSRGIYDHNKIINILDEFEKTYDDLYGQLE